jgi:hypothetical protein
MPIAQLGANQKYSRIFSDIEKNLFKMYRSVDLELSQPKNLNKIDKVFFFYSLNWIAYHFDLDGINLNEKIQHLLLFKSNYSPFYYRWHQPKWNR